MVGPLDPVPPEGESEAEAANRQNTAAEQSLTDIHEAGHGVPGGPATQTTGGTGPTGATAATTTKPGGMTSEGEPDSSAGPEGGEELKGMLGEGV